jgi:Phage tail assembly chaperone proteins, E, or 41 or 14
MPNVTIKLLDPIMGHGGDVKEIVLREPTYREVMQFGEPWARGYSRDNQVVYQAENIETIRSYIEACFVPNASGPQADVTLIESLSLADTLRVKDAVLDFFTSARAKALASATSK